MTPDYTQAQLMSDIMATITANAGTVVLVAVTLAAVNFIVGWFMHALTFITDRPFRGR